jgi:hypothetical protein
MGNLIFGLPYSTFFIVTGVPIVIMILLVIWGIWYKPDKDGSSVGKGGEK